MATDTTLVQGAYDANRYRGSGVDTAQKAIGDDLNVAVGKLAANKREEKEAEKAKATERAVNAEKILNGQGLVDGDVQLVKGGVLELQEQYLDPNTSLDEKQKIQEKLEKIGVNMSDANDFMIRASEMQLNPEMGVSKGATAEQQEWLDYINGSDAKLVKGKDGEYGYKKPDGTFVSTTEANQMLTEFEVDADSQNTLLTYATNEKEQVESNNEGTKFDKDVARDNVEALIDKSSNQRSLYFDSMFGNTSFIDDLKKGEFNITYEQLNITPPAGDKDGMFNPEDKLSEEDQESVIKAFMDNDDMEDQRKTLLGDYLFTHIKNNYTKAYKTKWGEDAYAELYPAKDETQQLTEEEKSSAVVATV